MQSWCTIWLLDDINRTFEKQHLFMKIQKVRKMLLEPTHKPKVISIDSSLVCGKVCEELSSNHFYANTPTFSIKWYCWKSSTQNQGRNFCSIVAILDEKCWFFHGIFILCTNRSRPLVGRRNTTSRKAFLENQYLFCLDDRKSPFFANVQLRLHQFGKESFTRNIFRICTSSWEKWCFGNSRSQSSQRRMWFSTPSSIPKLWYKMWLPNGFSRTRAKQKISGDGNESTKILRAVEKHKVINTHNSLKCGKTCEYLSWNHRTSTPHRSETNSIAARVVRRVKEGMRTMRIGFTKDWTVMLWDERETTSVTCESSLWALLRDSVTLADVLVLRTTGSKWYNSDYDDLVPFVGGQQSRRLDQRQSGGNRGCDCSRGWGRREPWQESWTCRFGWCCGRHAGIHGLWFHKGVCNGEGYCTTDAGGTPSPAEQPKK